MTGLAVDGMAVSDERGEYKGCSPSKSYSLTSYHSDLNLINASGDVNGRVCGDWVG